MDKTDFFELGRAYLGVLLITIDAFFGSPVLNYVMHALKSWGLA